MAVSLLILPRFCVLKKLSSFFSTQNAVSQGNAFATSTQVEDLLSKFQAETEVNKRVCIAKSVQFRRNCVFCYFAQFRRCKSG